MRKLFIAAILSASCTGITARADDTPTPPVPAVPDNPVIEMTQYNLTPGTTQPTISTGPGGVTIRSGAATLQADKLIYRLASARKTEKAAFLGVATSRPPLSLLKQLKIKSCLVVDEVKAGSPAETAGLKPEDLIQKLDDQILLNPSQLEGLVRIHNPGDSVTLTILHEGSQTTLTAKLEEHEVLVTPDEAPGILNLQPGTSVPAFPARPWLNPQNGTGGGGFGGTGTGGGGTSGTGNLFVTPDGNAHVEVITKGQGGQPGFESQFSDGAHQLTIVRRDSKKFLTIRDNQGKQLFEGPVDTAEQQQAIPKDLLPKFQEMQKMANMTDDPLKPTGQP